jgi:hypothetical protein
MLTQAKLTDARKKLLAQWDSTQSDWNDAVSRRFGEKYLTPMEKNIQVAIAAMEQMQDVLRRIKRDCE